MYLNNIIFLSNKQTHKGPSNYVNIFSIHEKTGGQDFKKETDKYREKSKR